jgi:hypothetical protein
MMSSCVSVIVPPGWLGPHRVGCQRIGTLGAGRLCYKTAGWMPRGRLSDVACGSKTVFAVLKRDFRYTPENGLKSDIAPLPFGATTGLMHRSKLDVGPLVKWRITFGSSAAIRS